MDFKIQNHNGIMLIDPYGEMDQFFNSGKNSGIVDNIMDNPDSHLVLNFKDCISINSSSVKVLYKLINKYHDNDKEIILCNINSEVEDIFKIADLMDKVNIYKSEEEAMRFLS